ncbi:MDR/zinc-dependent alcohol dehydrogenase-like family protein [Planctomicrobium sp. SH664]|uniref:MDR/zinc-dependent alcohol dehydrogenase-like family protein n=1 Tax=Planctomicrobium sp. SH664 TaxID=3448125 RepID=UPI003F5C8C88
MRAVTFSDRLPLFTDSHTPTPHPTHIPIRVLQAGICETDLQLIQGYMNFRGVLGHEFVGIAETGRFAGQRVVGEINCACRQCDACERSLESHCPHRTVLGILNHDGAFADRVWLPEANLHLMPDHVSNDAAVFVEPLAAAFQIPAQVDLAPYRNVVILGDGRLGNLCAQVLALLGCDPLVVGKHPEKLERLSRKGIRTTLLEHLPAARTADLVVDCTGSASGFPTACRLVRPRGAIVLKTTVAGENGPNLAPVVIDEVRVFGSRCGPFAPAIRALAEGSIEVESLITARYPLEAAREAFETAQQKNHLKVLFEIAGPTASSNI